MSERIAISRSPQEAIPGHWYTPRRAGPATRSRYLRKIYRNHYDADHPEWVVYEVVWADGSRVKRHCRLDIWTRWAGWRIES
jgi:hypothetical protein